MIDALTEYGNAYGTIFQIVDDILDVTATDEQLGKPAGHDLIEGVYTLPVLRTLALGNQAAADLGELLGHPLDLDQRDTALADRAQQCRRRVGDRHAHASVSHVPKRPATTSPTPRRPSHCARRRPR